MMKKYGLLLLLFSLPHGLYAQTALDNLLTNLNTLNAQFEQKLFNETGHLLERSEGKMYVQRPDKFHWNYQKPYHQLIVADGKQVWIYDSDLEQVTVKNFNAALGKTPALLLSRNQKIEQDFFVNPLPAKQGITRFELVPKDAQAQFDSIRLNLRGETLLGFELVDNLGQTTLINFTAVEKNQKLEEGLFIFTPPAGVDILRE